MPEKNCTLLCQMTQQGAEGRGSDYWKLYSKRIP